MSTSLSQEKQLATQSIVHHEPVHLYLEQSLGLSGKVEVSGAKNAVLVTMAALILTEGKSVLSNVPASADVFQMMWVLRELGADVSFNQETHQLYVDTTFIRNYNVNALAMKKMRASVLVMGPLLCRFGKAEIALPGGCRIGARPVDFHLKNFAKMGVSLDVQYDTVFAHTTKLKATSLVLEYPSIGATENIMMAATLTHGTTTIINAALEPEVLDLITVLKKMGAHITIEPPATIIIEGVSKLNPVEHTVMVDRLETGGLLLASAITGGTIHIPNARPDHLEVFLLKLEEMGHTIMREQGIKLCATKEPQAVSFRTSPYPGFPTDLQAPMMVACCLAEGVSTIHETVFENRFLHINELQKMGAQIRLEGDRAYVTGVEELFGTAVIATDIRASCALALAGLAAKGKTIMTGVSHWQRGYDGLEYKLHSLGARIFLEKKNIN